MRRLIAIPLLAWLERTASLVGVARLEQRHENLLINVFHFIAGDARSQETGHGGSYVVEQEAAGIPIPALHALHQLCAYPAAFESPRVNSLFYSPSAALGHGAGPSRLTIETQFIRRIKTAWRAFCGNKRQPAGRFRPDPHRPKFLASSSRAIAISYVAAAAHRLVGSLLSGAIPLLLLQARQNPTE